MTRRLVLHVGPHKTGTTALQYQLLHARAALAAHGWSYPDVGMAQFGHHRIFAHLMGRAQQAGDFDEAALRRALDGSEHVVLSSEEFIYLPVDRMRQLAGWLDGFAIEPVLFVRTPVDLWPSHWQELVKHGRHETLLEYLAAYCGWNATIEAAVMNPLVQCNRLGEAFGRERLRLFCYDNLAETGTDIFAQFWSDVLRIAAPMPAVEVRKLNPSLPSVMVELLRSLNERHREQSGRAFGDFLLKRYLDHRSAIEALPRYREFAEAFAAQAATITLQSNQELFRHRERMLLASYGRQIENKAADDRIFARALYQRTTPYAHRYWTDRAGFRLFVDGVLNDITA